MTDQLHIRFIFTYNFVKAFFMNPVRLSFMCRDLDPRELRCYCFHVSIADIRDFIQHHSVRESELFRFGISVTFQKNSS